MKNRKMHELPNLNHTLMPILYNWASRRKPFFCWRLDCSLSPNRILFSSSLVCYFSLFKQNKYIFLTDFSPRNVNEKAVDQGNCFAHLFRPVSLTTMRSESISKSDLNIYSRPSPKCWHSQFLLSRSLVG